MPESNCSYLEQHVTIQQYAYAGGICPTKSEPEHPAAAGIRCTTSAGGSSAVTSWDDSAGLQRQLWTDDESSCHNEQANAEQAEQDNKLEAGE